MHIVLTHLSFCSEQSDSALCGVCWQLRPPYPPSLCPHLDRQMRKSGAPSSGTGFRFQPHKPFCVQNSRPGLAPHKDSLLNLTLSGSWIFSQAWLYNSLQNPVGWCRIPHPPIWPPSISDQVPLTPPSGGVWSPWPVCTKSCLVCLAGTLILLILL